MIIKVALVGLLFTISTLVSGCATIVRQDQVGVRETLGSYSTVASGPGLKFFLWPFLDIVKVPVRTINLEVSSDLPSKEGLTISSEISILYRVIPETAPLMLGRVGTVYENELILPVFRSAIADVTARFDAKDMHTGQRAAIEEEVRKQMDILLKPRGFEIEAVLLKNIRLPSGLARSIEERLQAEQQAQRMVFILDQEKQEAERKLIEARGIRDAQKTVAQGLSPLIIQFKSIEAFKALSSSQNAKVIITQGKAPFLLDSSSKD